jgi:predicted Zn-dependent peptidase
MTPTASALEFKHTTLPNGLTVIAELNPQAKSTALGYFVRTGSRDEQADQAGISHFLEHMLFKGAGELDGLGVNLEFDRMGAQYNAFTGEENTVYYGAVLPEFAPDLLKLWTLLMRPDFRQEEFDTEKEVILEEIAMYQDRPSTMIFDWARAQFFAGHSLGNSVLGTADSIRALTKPQMVQYHAGRYAPSNLVLALAGQVDWEATLAQLADLTQAWTPTQTTRSYASPTPRTGELRKPYDKASQVYLTIMAPGFSAQDPRRYAAHVLCSILGEEGNSRLHWALTDKGLVESVSAGSDEHDQYGLFYVYAQTDPENEGQVVSILRQELERLEAHGVSEQEVQRAKTKAATGLVLAGETPMQRLFSLGTNFVYNKTYQPLSELAAALEAVTVQDVNDLLRDKPFSQSFLYGVVPEKG